MARCSLPSFFVKAANSSASERRTIAKQAPDETTAPEFKKHNTVSSPLPNLGKVLPKRLPKGRGLLVGMGAGAVFVLGGIGIITPQQSDVTTQEFPSATSPAQSVTVATAENSRVKQTIKATGSVAAFDAIPVSSPVGGLEVQQVLVEEGAIVEKGQLMASLENSELQAKLSQAKAAVAEAKAHLAEVRAGKRPEEVAQAAETVNSAEAEVEQAQSNLNLARQQAQRYRMLAEQGAIARDRLDRALNKLQTRQSQLQQAQANLREARQRLSQLEGGNRAEVIRQAQAQLASAKAKQQSVAAKLKNTWVVAPMSGEVAERNVSVGDVTSPSQDLFTIIENGRLELSLNVPETQLGEISPGQQVKITSDAQSDLRLWGKVRKIAPTVEKDSRQGTVKVELPADQSLRPGIFLQASIITSAEKSLTVPSEAVQPQTNGRAIVYQLQANNTVKAQPVETGETTPDGRVEIVSGLSRGDLIVVEGAAYLRGGDRVKVVRN
jgi:multidrug efflux pump subunit AcrA (membrane-fusion protein)